MQDSVERLTSSIRSSQMLRLLLIGFLALLLQIPIAMITGLVSERQGRRQEAVAEVSSKWGNIQIITGPALVVPYTYRWTEFAMGGQEITRTEARNAIFLPDGSVWMRSTLLSQFLRESTRDILEVRKQLRGYAGFLCASQPLRFS